MPDEPVGEIPKFELSFLEYLFQASPNVQSETLKHVHLEHFTDPRVLRLLGLAFDQHEQEGAINPQRIADLLGGDIALHGVFASLLVPRNEISSRWSSIQTVHEPDQRKALLEAYKRILSEFLERRIAAVKNILQEMQADPDHALICLKAYNALLAKQKELKGADSIEALPEIHSGDEADGATF
jgi:hypothetical protein